MDASRATQPYRKSESRGPSQVLTKMQQGRTPGAGNALMDAAKRGAGKNKKLIPRY